MRIFECDILQYISHSKYETKTKQAANGQERRFDGKRSYKNSI